MTTRRRWVYVKGDLVEVTAFKPESRSTSYQVMRDIDPYVSMVDGKIITSRSRHREHLRDHGCVEIGNDSSLTREPKPIASPPGLKEAIIRAADEVLEKRRRS